MEKVLKMPTKSVLHFDKKWNLVEREDEVEDVVLNESLGRLLLRTLGTTPEIVLDTIVNKKEGKHNDEVGQEYIQKCPN